MGKKSFAVVSLILMLLLVSCYRPASRYEAWQVPASGSTLLSNAAITETPFTPATRAPGALIVSPTPNPPKELPTQRTESEQYIVQPGDTLAKIGMAYQVSVAQIMAQNDLINPDLIEVGQAPLIPAVSSTDLGIGFKIIPDSELVYGPFSALFNIEETVGEAGGYLAQYTEILDEMPFSGPEVVERVAQEYSVNPRLLLSVLEYKSGWVTCSQPAESTLIYPMGNYDSCCQGLYKQLAWAANELNRGFYLWQLNALSVWIISDGSVILIDPTINAGTAGVQYLMTLLYDRQGWEDAVSENGLFATFEGFFGYPFDYTYEPLLPESLEQPNFQLPFEPGLTWSFTGGPHGGWDDGSAWAALDFAPPGEALGCYPSNAYVTAVAAGLIVRSELGAVVQDLDGDGYEQTGWTILYMHISSADRVTTGSYLEAGDLIGHPSCEGGFSTGTHLHIARRYNGVWVSADGQLPFMMDGWVSSGYGIEYDGYLVKDEQTVEAWNGRSETNQIWR